MRTASENLLQCPGGRREEKPLRQVNQTRVKDVATLGLALATAEDALASDLLFGFRRHLLLPVSHLILHFFMLSFQHDS